MVNYNMKNFTIKKSINRSRNTHKKQYSSELSDIFLSKTNSQTNVEDPSTSALKEFQKQIKEIWDMAKCMGIEISQQSIIKYMRKTMQKNNYKYTDFITENYRNPSFKMQNKAEEINFQQLLYQVHKIKEEVQDFIFRKFVKEISIMEEKIQKQDELIRDSLELSHYQIITGSFRPLLISNPTDLVQELQNIGGHPTKRNCSKLQQMRYQKLAKTERTICNLHNMVCEFKQDAVLQHH